MSRRTARGPIGLPWPAAVAAILVVVLGLTIAGVRVTHAGKVLPGVRVDGSALAGDDEDEVRARVKTIADAGRRGARQAASPRIAARR